MAVLVEVPPGVVTVTFTAPAVPAGVVAVIWVAEFTSTPVAALAPNFTVAPLTKPVPVTVTDVPPAAGLEDGDLPAVGEEANCRGEAAEAAPHDERPSSLWNPHAPS